ncbi:MAG: aminoacyl-tRNA hydrolase [Mariprofundaceae bacterium]|nr:aminoacyl-tRNA hydrolase [Mariprofundaceae bacterium]
MKILVGLGNPGSKYQDTRHNIGFRFLDQLAQSEGVQFSASPRFRAETASWNSHEGKVLLLKPQTFMNDSGESLAALVHYYDIEAKDVTVIYDDLDLPSGKIRLKVGGGHGGHNGLRSINAHVKDTSYTRIKVGIGRPTHGAIVDWVLGRASEDDRADEARIFHILEEELLLILASKTDIAANHIHLKLNPS